MTSLCRLLILALVSLGPQVEKPADTEQIWKDFLTYFRTATQEGNPIKAYVAELQKKGVSPEESRRQSAIIMRLLGERTEGVALLYDRIYTKPFSGNPEMDGFLSEPSAVLVDAAKRLKPAMALDAAMGQGRNALYLAQAGWDVTGFDISEKGLSIARANAEKMGLRIHAAKAGYDTFEFGTDKWDLIVMTYAWAPVSDPAFVSKIRDSLRKGGNVIFEHFIRDADHPYPDLIHALAPGQLKICFSGFRIELYEEFDGIGEWGGPGSRLVRMIAQK